MNILYFAFANSQEAGGHLPNLVQEESDIKNALEDGVGKGDYRLVQDSFASLDGIAEMLQKHQDNLVWFHYSGHAERDALILNDEEIRSKGIAHLLKQCPKLKGVVLNGCSTKWQAEELREAGIPVVIGTSAPVEDVKAMKFAGLFYKMLNRGKTVEQSFEMGMGVVLGEADVEYFRGVRPPKEEKTDKPLWGLFNEDDDALALKLPFGSESIDDLKKRLNKLVQSDMKKTLNELELVLKDDSRAYNSYINLSSRYNRNKSRENGGTANQSSIDITYNQVLGALRSLIQDLDKEDLK